MKGLRRNDPRSRSNRRRWHTLERLEGRCVLAATVSGQVFNDLNGDQLWQVSAPVHQPSQRIKPQAGEDEADAPNCVETQNTQRSGLGALSFDNKPRDVL